MLASNRIAQARRLESLRALPRLDLEKERGMSRSRRKTPILGITTAASEANDKARWHRAYRRAERQRLRASPESLPASHRDYSDPWSMDKDGKRYWGKACGSRWMRK